MLAFCLSQVSQQDIFTFTTSHPLPPNNHSPSHAGPGRAIDGDGRQINFKLTYCGDHPFSTYQERIKLRCQCRLCPAVGFQILRPSSIKIHQRLHSRAPTPPRECTRSTPRQACFHSPSVVWITVTVTSSRNREIHYRTAIRVSRLLDSNNSSIMLIPSCL